MDDEDRFTRITLRIPKDLHQQVSDAADAAARSTNAEIVARIARSFQTDQAGFTAKSSTLLLRTLASFIVIREKFPDGSAALEEAAIELARAVKETPDDVDIANVSQPHVLRYIAVLTGMLNEATEILGQGWAREMKDGEAPEPEIFSRRSFDDVPGMTALVFLDGHLRLIGDTAAINDYLVAHGFESFEVEGRGLNIPAARGGDVAVLLGLPSGGGTAADNTRAPDVDAPNAVQHKAAKRKK